MSERAERDLTELPYGGTTLFTINHIKRSARFDMRGHHFHDYYEIYYLRSGERNYFIKDNIYRVTKGDLVFINENDLHQTTGNGVPPAHERIVIYFRKEALGEHRDLLESAYSPFRTGSPILSMKCTSRRSSRSFSAKFWRNSKLAPNGSSSI